MLAHAIRRGSTQKHSNTVQAGKVCAQTAAPMAIETPVQIAAIHGRTPVGVRPVKLALEQRSSATGAGSCGPSTSHDRRRRVASLAPPRLKTFQKGNLPTASREWRFQKRFVCDATRAHTKRT